KIIDKARDENRPWYNLAYQMRLEADHIFAALIVLPPTYEPAVTAHAPEILGVIDELVRAMPTPPTGTCTSSSSRGPPTAS
ncbi:MAG: hypothetical protein ABJD68_15820, partial [Nakamurella sp.]